MGVSFYTQKSKGNSSDHLATRGTNLNLKSKGCVCLSIEGGQYTNNSMYSFMLKPNCSPDSGEVLNCMRRVLLLSNYIISSARRFSSILEPTLA